MTDKLVSDKIMMHSNRIYLMILSNITEGFDSINFCYACEYGVG